MRDTTEIYLIRHGETTLSAQGKYIGATEVSLSDNGRAQARLLAEHLREVHFDACYCSIMQRCQETAQLVAAPHHLAIQPLTAIREIDYGAWEQLTTAEMHTRDPEHYLAWKRDPAAVQAPQGESGADVLARIQPTFEELATQHPGQRLIVVAHRTVNRIWLCHLLGQPLATYRQAVGQDFTALNIISKTPAGWLVNVINTTAHLAA